MWVALIIHGTLNRGSRQKFYFEKDFILIRCGFGSWGQNPHIGTDSSKVN